VNSSYQYKANRKYDASAGKISIDLSGTRGRLQQSITKFVVGKTYRVSFDLSGNPAATVDPLLRLTVSGITPVTDFTFARPGGQTASNMGWMRVATDFIATNTRHVIYFENGNLTANTNFGPVIDNVIIGEALPEPQNWALFIIGFGLIGVVSRRSATRQAA
jgi:hypothetical protein